LEYNTLMEQTVGQRLKSIRESRGISLEEISQETNIRLKYLRAIESNDVDALPSPMQMRGFLRLYANSLDMEIEDLKVEGYHLSQLEQTAESPPPVSDNKPDKEESKPDTTSTEKQNLQQKDEIEQKFPSISEPQQETDSRYEPIPEEKEEITTEKGKDELNSSVIFSQIGEKLRNRRNLLSLSLEDVRSQLHIRKHYLEAIEEGEIDELPSPIQAKGMLTNYADFLNLDVDAILLNFAEGLQQQRLEKTSSYQKKNRPAKELSKTALRLRNFFSLDLLIITAIFIGFAAFVIWGANRIMSADSPEKAATSLPEVADVLLATSSSTPQLTSAADITTEVENGEDISDTEETPLFLPGTTNGAINIIVIPLQQVWVRITSDSEMIYEGRLLPGNAYDYSAEEKVEILTGNAGALQIYLNDQDLGSMGLMGQVANLVFTQDGLILPTPTNTPTPTETPKVSPTPTLTPSPSPTPSVTNDQES
jgi:cytoskeleton protein RodZ